MGEVGRVVAGWDEGQRCAGADCIDLLSNDVGVFMFRNIVNGRLALVCRACAIGIELDPAIPWALVNL